MPARGMEEIFSEFRERYAELFPEPFAQCAVILRAAEEIAQQFAKRRAATSELDHARGDGSSEESAAKNKAHKARGDFQVGDKFGAQLRGITFRLTLDDGLREQIAGTKRVEQSFARDGIDARSGIARERPIPADDFAMAQRAKFRRRKHVAVKTRAVRGDFFFANEIVEKLAQF